MDNNPEEWYVAYHGIRVPNMHKVINNLIKFLKENFGIEDHNKLYAKTEEGHLLIVDG